MTAGQGQGAGGVEDALEHLVEVQALVDAEAGLAEARQALPQRLYLPLPIASTWFSMLLLWKVIYNSVKTPSASGLETAPLRGSIAMFDTRSDDSKARRLLGTAMPVSPPNLSTSRLVSPAGGGAS